MYKYDYWPNLIFTKEIDKEILNAVKELSKNYNIEKFSPSGAKLSGKNIRKIFGKSSETF